MLSLPPEQLKKLLVDQNIITQGQLDSALEDALRMNQNPAEILISEGFLSQDYWYQILAGYLGAELASLGSRGIDRNILSKVEEKMAREKGLIAFGQEADGTLLVAMQDPTDLPTIEFLEKKMGSRIRPYLATPDDLAKGFSLYGKQLTEDFKQVIKEKIQASLKSAASAENEEEAATQLPIVDIVNNLLSYAASLRASDIHWEVLADTVLVRFRIDGILYEIMRVPKEVHMAVLARIKLLSTLKVDEHQKPQDGRFRFKSGQQILDVRVSVIPTLYGEKIVMRLLPAAQRPLSLGELGMSEDMVKMIERNIKKTYGMVLVTGPTGSGKTTTLYAVLNILNHTEVNIVTIEDPIEYNIKYVNQIQINPVAGITFASGLRSILRQDPNIIMVGEIRDEETADIAVNAALTGHLLLSTLHTNDAPTAVPRLIDMNVPPFLVSAVLNVVLAQRLVRKICINCIESYTPTQQALETIKRQIQDLHPGEEKEIEMPKTLYKGKGCKVCNGSGYKGRMGIFEIFEMTDEMRQFIVNPNFTLEGLVVQAKKSGMISMLEDGMQKASVGQTTLEEVLRVIRE